TVSGNVRVGIDTLGPVDVLGSTVVDNGAAFEGSPYTVGGSMLGGSSGPTCVSSAASSLGYNVVADASCQLGGPGDQENVDLVLTPLADNGGPTPTHLPAANSPAVDAVPVGTAELCD